MNLTLSSAWSLALQSDHPVAQRAASELRMGLAQLGGPLLLLDAAAAGPRITLSHGLAGDGFTRAPAAHGFALHGDGPRGLLYAVYDLLEELGLRWPAPGAVAVPHPLPRPLRLPASALSDQPALPVRSLVLGHDIFLAEAEVWLEWAARNRLNTLFIHTTIHEPALGACRLATWRTRRAQLLPLLRSLGMRIELGGHHLRDLLPRRLFRHHPERFRYDGQRRNPDHNFCASNPQTHAILREMAAAFFHAYPEAEVYHLWPDDLREAGWCQCEACRALSPADQTLLATNTLAEVLAAQRPGAQVSFLAYHDSAHGPQRSAPHPNVALLFAPRLRSYAVGLNTPANVPIAQQLAACVAAFGVTSDSEPQARLGAFEYYLDGILFKSAPPPLPDVIAADLHSYQQLGLGSVHVLLTGDRPYLHAPPNAYLFARLAWDTHADPEVIMRAYATARIPNNPTALHNAYRTLARAWQPLLTREPMSASKANPASPPPLLPAASPPRRTLRDPVANPPADVLDMLDEDQRSAELRLEALHRASADLAEGAAAWHELGTPTLPVELAGEYAEWSAGAKLLTYIRLRQQLYVLAGRNASRSSLREALAEAQSALDALLTWAELYVPKRDQAGHRLLRAALQLHLDQIADQQIHNPLGRLGLRARRAGDLAKLLPGMLRLRDKG
ncbi:MAG: DUF4838 domain-containing protein [Candidatus Viridilinea halotolerans]|uniref:DUF4838 domain-containing protein n=1 Tax=Candidatus Viridilinea halotolerans TaxID=2491704 RepID=A0A426U6U9_9CHLR|nr:MAG: DUF4838 domain-containing protein [Candidatus Viridilinea halotolerans]